MTMAGAGINHRQSGRIFDCAGNNHHDTMEEEKKMVITKKKIRHPTYFQMIALAINGAAMKKKGRSRSSGCSRQAIAKFIREKFGRMLPDSRIRFQRVLSRKLKQLAAVDHDQKEQRQVNSAGSTLGLLMRVSRGSYKLSPKLKRSRTFLNQLLKLNNIVAAAAASAQSNMSMFFQPHPHINQHINPNHDPLDNSSGAASTITSSLEHQSDSHHIETPIISIVCVSPPPPGSPLPYSADSMWKSLHYRSPRIGNHSKLNKKRHLQQLLITMNMNVNSSTPAPSKMSRRRLRYSGRWLLRPISLNNRLVA